MLKKSAVLLSARSMLAGTAAFGGWLPTAGGTYDYNAPANWSDGMQLLMSASSGSMVIVR